jgi:hypothetical protein
MNNTRMYPIYLQGMISKEQIWLAQNSKEQISKDQSSKG